MSDINPMLILFAFSLLLNMALIVYKIRRDPKQ